MRLPAALLLAATLAASAAGPAKIRFVKDFPNSDPAYTAIWIDQSGAGEWTDSPDGARPVAVQLEPAETAAIFGLAEKLNYFARPLEASAKVASTGAKSFRYESDSANHEVKFNYTTDADGRALTVWFEKISETMQRMAGLESAAKFDKLGVDREILLLQATLEGKRLAGGRQLLPLLDRVAANQTIMKRARERAASIAEAIRAGMSGQN
jgi:hypothetical protein